MGYLYCYNCIYLITRVADHFSVNCFSILMSHTPLRPTEYFILCMCPNLFSYILVGYLCCFQMTVNIFVHKAFFSSLLDFFLQCTISEDGLLGQQCGHFYAPIHIVKLLSQGTVQYIVPPISLYSYQLGFVNKN